MSHRYRDRIHHVHLKDIRTAPLKTATKNNVSFLEAVLLGVFTVPGDGLINFKPLITFLQKTGYRGWLVVEADQDPMIAPPLETATLAFQTIHRLVQETTLLSVPLL